MPDAHWPTGLRRRPTPFVNYTYSCVVLSKRGWYARYFTLQFHVKVQIIYKIKNTHPMYIKQKKKTTKLQNAKSTTALVAEICSNVDDVSWSRSDTTGERKSNNIKPI